MDDKRDNIFDENIKNEEHIEETSKKTEDEMKETSDRESMKETQKLFNNENIDEMKETVDEDFGGDYGEHIEEPYDHSIEQEIYDEPYMEDSKAKDKEFESYVDGIVQKEFEKRRKGNRLKSVSKFLLAIVLASSISIAGTSAYLKSNSGKSLLNQSSTDKGATTTTINTSDKPNVEKAVAQKSMQSVVGITTVGVSEDMFSTQKQTKGLGSGVIVSKEGYILTNNHVVDPSKTKSVTVILSDGTKRKAKVLWSDKTLDLAVIKIDPKGLDLKPVEFGDSSQVSIGDKAIAIGNPLGINLKSTLTSGYISGKDRVITLQDGSTMEGLFQTDAAILEIVVVDYLMIKDNLSE